MKKAVKMVVAALFFCWLVLLALAGADVMVSSMSPDDLNSMGLQR